MITTLARPLHTALDHGIVTERHTLSVILLRTLRLPQRPRVGGATAPAP
jgi:hypothetical protein